MTLEWFAKLLEANNAIGVTNDDVIFNDYELYNHKTKEEKHYKNIYELAEDNPKIKDIILNTEIFYNPIDGGRGATSGAMGGGFNHAKGSGKGNNGKQLLNAELNINTKQKHNVNAVLKRFNEKYSDSKIEYGIAIDEQGYVHRHMQGNETSVNISGGKGMTIIHNHPSGGNFSDNDLISVARTQERGIIATSSNAKTKSTYRFEKKSNFDAKGFEKAVKGAKWPVGMSYDKGADWWLRKNANKYGYKYSASGEPKQ